jgi:uncharacterized membrane protein
MAEKTSGRKYSRQGITLFYGAIIAVIVITLLYFEQIAALYLLATLSLVVLLAVVALTDLEAKIAGLRRR